MPGLKSGTHRGVARQQTKRGLVQGIALDKMLAQYLGGPLSKTGTLNRLDPVTNIGVTQLIFLSVPFRV